MIRTRKAIVWLCIFSTLLVGCYSSELVYLAPGIVEIEYVLTKGGKSYHFDAPPIVHKDGVTGPTGNEQQKIPSDEIEYLVARDGSKYRFNAFPTTRIDSTSAMSGGKAKQYPVETTYLTTKQGTKYTFEGFPNLLNDTIIGVANRENGEVDVSVPVSDVAETGESQSGDYQFVVTKSGTMCLFDKSPKVVNGAIVGKAKVFTSGPVEVSIPVSDLAASGSSRSGGIEYALTNRGAKYIFEKPPAIVDKRIVGTARQITSGQRDVRIPLSDVVRAEVTKPDTTATTLVVLAAIAAVVGLVALAVSQIDYSSALAPVIAGL